MTSALPTIFHDQLPSTTTRNLSSPVTGTSSANVHPATSENTGQSFDVISEISQSATNGQTDPNLPNAYVSTLVPERSSTLEDQANDIISDNPWQDDTIHGIKIHTHTWRIIKKMIHHF